MKFGKHLTIILREMCKRVGANFDKIDFKNEGWFRTFSWTVKEEENFKKWMVDYLFKNQEARFELMTIIGKNKKLIEKAVMMFAFNYGWIYGQKKA